MGVLEILTDVCLLPFLKLESETRKKCLPNNVSKYIFSLLPRCPSTVDEIKHCGLDCGRAAIVQFRKGDLMVEG